MICTPISARALGASVKKSPRQSGKQPVLENRESDLVAKECLEQVIRESDEPEYWKVEGRRFEIAFIATATIGIESVKAIGVPSGKFSFDA